MKRKTLKSLFSVIISVIVVCCLFIFLYLKNKNSIIQSNLIKEADSIVNENIINCDAIKKSEEQKQIEECEAFSIEKISSDNNVLGKIKIPAINVEAPIKEGVTQDVLKESVGHFCDSSYWNGNVALASNNRGTYAHYFEKINKLQINDEIIYQTKLGTRVYIVTEINQISENDLSVLEKSNKNILTLITCVKDKKNLRLCVQASEKV